MTAHEAMLLQTPVIGSGRGGMRELLEGGKQIVCQDFSHLKPRVEYLLNNSDARKKMGEDGLKFASQFPLEKFRDEWLKLVKTVIG